MDEKDRPFNFYGLVMKFPELLNIIPGCEGSVKGNPENFTEVQTLDVLMNTTVKDSDEQIAEILGMMKNPPIELTKKLFAKEPRLAQKAEKSLPLEVQLDIIKKTPSYLAYLKQPSIETVKAAGMKQVSFQINKQTDLTGYGWEGPLSEFVASNLMPPQQKTTIGKSCLAWYKAINRATEMTVDWNTFHGVLGLIYPGYARQGGLMRPTWQYYITGTDKLGNVWGWRKYQGSSGASGQNFLYVNGHKIGNSFSPLYSENNVLITYARLKEKGWVK